MPNARELLAWPLAALACLQAACSTPVRPDHLAQPDKRSLGRIAVAAARFEPEYAFDALTAGKGEAATKGAFLGVGSCAQAVGSGGGVGGALFFVVCAPIAATVGAISGALGAATAEQVEAAKAAAQPGIAALKLQDGTVEAVLRYGKEMGIDLGRLPRSLGPAKPDDPPSYAEAGDTANSVIEVSVLSARAFTTGARELRMSLGMQARVRVLSTRDGKEIDTLSVRCESASRTPDEWLAADGQAIKTALDLCAASIAEQALDEVLFVYHPKQMREEPPSTETQRVPPYALRAIEPPIRNKVYLNIARMTYGHLERYALGSLQPEFRWEPWPRGFDIAPGSGPGQAREVRYDLRILSAEGVAYERRGLVETVHRLEQPLTPCRTYRWTVRARFNLGDAPRVTEWTGAYDTMGGPVAPWWMRRGSGAPALAMIPGSPVPFYAIVETPGAKGETCPGRW